VKLNHRNTSKRRDRTVDSSSFLKTFSFFSFGGARRLSRRSNSSINNSSAEGATAQAGGGQTCNDTEPPDRVRSRFLACFRTRSGSEIWAG
jgi:hypothetical protein